MREARSRAMNDAAKLDRHWHIMRISSDEVPGKHLLRLSDEPDSMSLLKVARRSRMQCRSICVLKAQTDHPHLNHL